MVIENAKRIGNCKHLKGWVSLKESLGSVVEVQLHLKAKPRDTPPQHYASTNKLNSRHNAVTKETFAGHPPNPDASIRLPDCKARFITPMNSLPHVHSPMTVSSTPLQWMLHILWSDVWLASGCKTMESRVFLTLD
ncbi:hypothetical protein TNCV_3198481 [Trichonephila clavipes]|nr:hypothetical protein TNCV_3198481 [Trichonephila clavipes]